MDEREFLVEISKAVELPSRIVRAAGGELEAYWMAEEGRFVLASIDEDGEPLVAFIDRHRHEELIMGWLRSEGPVAAMNEAVARLRRQP